MRVQTVRSKTIERQRKNLAAGKRTSRDAKLKQVFAARLEAARVRQGWNQSELARRATACLPPRAPGQKQGKEIGRDLISHYSRALMLPRPEYLLAIAKALNMPPEDLLPRGSPSNTALAMLGSDPPAFRMEPSQDGRVWLRINRTVTMETALKVANLFNEEDGKA